MKFSLIKVNIDKWWGVGEWTMPRCHVEPTISPSFPVPEPTSTRRCAKCWEIYGLGCRGELGIMHREKRRQFTVIHNMCLRYRFSWLCFYSICFYSILHIGLHISPYTQASIYLRLLTIFSQCMLGGTLVSLLPPPLSPANAERRIMSMSLAFRCERKWCMFNCPRIN